MRSNFCKYILLAVTCLCLNQTYGQVDIGYYLPDITYDESITTPEEYLGYQIGEWHISHDQLVGYCRLIAAQSDRVEYNETGRTHEQRPLLALHISTPANLANKEEIRKQHIGLTQASSSNNIDITKLPLVLYQGYSVHGNESSGVNASALVLYYLAAGQGEEVKNVLSNTYILFDPCYNPDGVQRFSTWANSHKGYNLISDPQSREFNEMWPGGRTNHYWFDLNRDWLLLTQPESQARVKTYQDWKPNILTDHHEMGTNSTFFFQPGVPSRTNPNTPWKNQELTESIGEYHAKALDEIGSQYFTKQQYDDFYYGKGSTYPDIHGGIGILFEQASSRGHLQESDNGLLSFPFTIRNQVVTSLSTQRAGLNLRMELLKYKREFYQIKDKAARQSSARAYSYTDADLNKLSQFTDVLLRHDIKVYIDPAKADKTYVVPVDQTQYGLIKTIFEKVTSYQDSIFYDVSAWTLPLAYDLQYSELSASNLVLDKLVQVTLQDDIVEGELLETNNPYSWIFDWKQHDSPKILTQLLTQDILAKVNTDHIKVKTAMGEMTFGPGSIIVPLANQALLAQDIRDVLSELAKINSVDIYELTSGYGEGGMSTGNPKVKALTKANIFTLIGDGVSSYDAGELWHYVDHHLGTTITMIDVNDLRSSNLKRYNTLILTNGSYRTLGDKDKEKIKKWVENGGQVIAMRGALKMLKDLGLVKLEIKKYEKNEKLHAVRQYQSSEKTSGAAVLGGAIFSSTLDLSHPLAYGYTDSELPLFRKGTTFFEVTDNEFATPLRYNTSFLHSGYVPRGVKEMAQGAAAASVHRYGDGTVICFSDNLLFRGYWWGTHRLMANAIYFGDFISSSNKEKAPK